MFGFMIGALLGSAAAYVWHDKIRGYLDTQLPTIRDRAAEQIGTFGARAGEALDQAKTRIDSTVRTSQQRLRSTQGGRSGPSTGAPFSSGD